MVWAPKDNLPPAFRLQEWNRFYFGGSVKKIYYCSDIQNSKPGYLAPNCCESCHHEEDNGYNNLLLYDHLHCCCTQLNYLKENGVDAYEESQVKNFVKTKKMSKNLADGPGIGVKFPMNG